MTIKIIFGYFDFIEVSAHIRTKMQTSYAVHHA